jgi:hypothetical protein
MRRGRALVLAALVLAVAACGSVERPVPQSPPAGQVALDYRGVQVFVPKDWPRNRLRCGTPAEDTVVVDPGPQPMCLIRPTPVVSYAWLRNPEDPDTDPDAVLATHPVSLQGHPARRGEDQLSDGRTRIVVVVTDRKVVVVAVSKDPALASRIADSVRVM